LEVRDFCVNCMLPRALTLQMEPTSTLCVKKGPTFKLSVTWSNVNWTFFCDTVYILLCRGRRCPYTAASTWIICSY